MRDRYLSKVSVGKERKGRCKNKRQITKIVRKGERESEKRWGRGKSKRKRKTDRDVI